MNVQALSPDQSHQSVYAELGEVNIPRTAANVTATPPHPSTNGTIENGMNTLTSQSSTLRSKYQYKSPLEREVERGQREMTAEEEEEEERLDQIPQIANSSTRSSRRSSTAQRRLFQSNDASQQHTRSLSLTKYKRSRTRGGDGRDGSSSPTDTVSSFEYESHSQINDKLAALQSQASIDGGGQSIPVERERRGFMHYPSDPRINPHYNQQHAPRLGNVHPSLCTTGPLPTTDNNFRHLPDLALMTTLPSSSLSIGPYSPALSDASSRISSSTAKGHVSYNNPYNKVEEDYYQTPRAARHAAMTAKLSLINSQMSLV